MEQLELVFPTARNTDPETSHRAGENVRIRAGSQQYRLLQAYAEYPDGLIDEEAGMVTGLDKLPRCCYWKRCSELRSAGLIEPTGAERLSTALQSQRVCRITEAGRQIL